MRVRTRCGGAAYGTPAAWAMGRAERGAIKEGGPRGLFEGGRARWGVVEMAASAEPRSGGGGGGYLRLELVRRTANAAGGRLVDGGGKKESSAKSA